MCPQVLKLEAALLRSERERDEQGEAVFRARADSHRRVAHLRSSLQVCAFLMAFLLNRAAESHEILRECSHQ